MKDRISNSPLLLIHPCCLSLVACSSHSISIMGDCWRTTNLPGKPDTEQTDIFYLLSALYKIIIPYHPVLLSSSFFPISFARLMEWSIIRLLVTPVLSRNALPVFISKSLLLLPLRFIRIVFGRRRLPRDIIMSIKNLQFIINALGQFV